MYVKESGDPSGRWGCGGRLFDSVTLWRSAEVGCSVTIFTVVIGLTRVCRKPGISSVSRKKK